MTLRIGLLGRGRLGSLVEAAADSTNDAVVVWTAGRGPIPSDAVDVAIDVSTAAAVPEHIEWAISTGTNLVLGVTGWSEDQTALTSLRQQGDQASIGVLIAPNFSLSIALMHRLSAVLGRYAARLGSSADLAISETHHRAKVDAPSGTAVALRSAVAAAAQRNDSDIQTTSLRVGAVVGQHQVRLETDLETIELRHEAHSRSVFADGALQAARWAQGKKGVFNLDDWADAELAHLFAPATY
ncbi:4-hydroxy-tetrahydrodipicolinate reductase [Ornithinimicrobium sp. Arc0846-15]|nr:4-hydroxy-tetrahydrodipicolinate reductase [Ornithinimicrobium laminariae]